MSPAPPSCVCDHLRLPHPPTHSRACVRACVYLCACDGRGYFVCIPSRSFSSPYLSRRPTVQRNTPPKATSSPNITAKKVHLLVLLAESFNTSWTFKSRLQICGKTVGSQPPSPSLNRVNVTCKTLYLIFDHVGCSVLFPYKFKVKTNPDAVEKLLRQKKKKCWFRVTWPKKVGSVGRIFVCFVLFFGVCYC